MADLILPVQVSTVVEVPKEWRHNVFYWEPSYAMWLKARREQCRWVDDDRRPLPSDTILALMPSPDQAAPYRYAEALERARDAYPSRPTGYEDREDALRWNAKRDVLEEVFPELKEVGE